MNGPHGKGDIVGNRYEIVNYISEGGMQFVYRALDRTLRREVALKTPKGLSAEKRFRGSSIASAKVNHPNVAKTLDYLEDGGKCYLIEELVEGENLSKALLARAKFLDPFLAAKILHHLAKGLCASHRVGVVHRDLKPTNLMVVGGLQLAEIKITDFGIAKMANEELAEAAEGGEDSFSGSPTAIGALPYMAPEAIDTPRKVGKPADVWSIGAMLFSLVAGEAPYGIGLRAVSKIQEALPPNFPAFVRQKPQFSHLSTQLCNIILECLNKDPAERPTADKLASACEGLCYPVAERRAGMVRSIRHSSWGFISDNGVDVFFHNDSVYGAPLKEGDMVMFSKYPGGGAWRAHPVVKIS